jgi:hypothetical protein
VFTNQLSAPHSSEWFFPFCIEAQRRAAGVGGGVGKGSNIIVLSTGSF